MSLTTAYVVAVADTGLAERIRSAATPVVGKVHSTRLADRRRKAGLGSTDQAERLQRRGALLIQSRCRQK